MKSPPCIKVVIALAALAIISSCGGESASPKSDSLPPTTSLPTDIRLPDGASSPNLYVTTYGGWVYSLSPSFAGIQLSGSKVIANSPPGRAQLNISMSEPTGGAASVVSEPSQTPGRTPPTPSTETYIIIEDAPYGETDFLIRTGCNRYTGDGFPNLLDYAESRKDTPKLFCGPFSASGTLPLWSSSTKWGAITEEIDEETVDLYSSILNSWKIKIGILIDGCMIIFEKNNVPTLLSNGDGKCRIQVIG